MSHEILDKNPITSFITENKIAAICCTDLDGKPYCFHCFYVFDEKNQLIFFKSSALSVHSQMIVKNPVIAGSILPQRIDLMALKGIQFTGSVLEEDIPGEINPESFYYKRLPLGLTKPGKVYCIQLDTIKMTDNSSIIGKKRNWNRFDYALEQ
jgi:uncharacterized protein YhbP (UPF0306 family)